MGKELYSWIMESKQSDFSYSGMLVFDQIYKTNVKGLDNIRGIEEYFPKFDQGNANVPGSGFNTNYLSDYEVHHQMSFNDFTFDRTIVDYFDEKSENIANIEYKFENFKDDVEAVVDDERRTVSVVKSDKFDFYWKYPNYFVRQGGRNIDKNIGRLFTNDFLESVDLEQIKFNSDFLLWLLYRSKNDNNLKENLLIKSISDVSLTGPDESRYGRMRYSGSNNPFNSPEVMKRILSGGKIRTLGISFILDSRYEIKADISDVGRIHVKPNTSDLSNKNDAERMILSLRLIELICDTYEVWTNSNEKIPDDFSNRIYDYIRDSGVEFSQGLSNIDNKYTDDGK